MKYPIKYFSGSGVQIFRKEDFERKIKFFDKLSNMTAPIVGETGIDGVLIDFNYGLRLQIPEGNWHVRISDYETDYIFFDDDISCVTLISAEKFFIEWEVALWLDGEPVFYHQFDPRGQKVHFHFSETTLGDNIALLIYIEAFRQKYDCEVSCSIVKPFHGIVRNYYPNVRLTSTLSADCYACFYMSMPINLPFSATENALSIPLLQVGNSILHCIDQPKKIIYTPTKPRSIKEKYVCISVQASSTAKSWLNPDGWSTVIEHLKSLGYRVLCIDRDRKCTNYNRTIEMPDGVEDLSGDYTLIDRVNQLAYADFFIGLGSGLSWLAWAVGIPVILISGISYRWYEFDTPYRINNRLVCHGCFNETRDGKAYNNCPLFKGTDREFECSKEISARQVINAVARLIADNNLNGRN